MYAIFNSSQAFLQYNGGDAEFRYGWAEIDQATLFDNLSEAVQAVMELGARYQAERGVAPVYTIELVSVEVETVRRVVGRV